MNMIDFEGIKCKNDEINKQFLTLDAHMIGHYAAMDMLKKLDTDSDGDDDRVLFGPGTRFKFDTKTPVKREYVPHPCKVWFVKRNGQYTTTVEYDDGKKVTTICDLQTIGYFSKFAEFCYNVAKRVSDEMPKYTDLSHVKTKELEKTYTFSDGKKIKVTAPLKEMADSERQLAIAITKKTFGSTSRVMRLLKACETYAHDKWHMMQTKNELKKEEKARQRELRQQEFEAAVKRRMFELAVQREANKRYFENDFIKHDY